MLPVLTPATWYQTPGVAMVVLRTVVGAPGEQPFVATPPRQNQKRLSACLSSRQPFVLMPLEDILSTMDISPVAVDCEPGGAVSDAKRTQASTLKSPAETCRPGAFATST